MKKVILILMCLAIALPSFSKKDDVKELHLTGDFIATSNVKFEVAIVNDDNSKVVVETKSSIFSYRIKLKIGNDYVIRFIKNGVIKELYVTADEPGLMEVDVDFKTDAAAQLCYNEKADDYSLTLLYKNE